MLPSPHLSQLSRQGFLALPDHISLGLVQDLQQIHLLSVLVGQDLGGLVSDLLAFSQHARRMHQVVATGLPEEIQQQAVILSWVQPEPAAYHLHVQAPDLGWSEDDNAVYTRTIPALSQEHRIAQDLVLASCEVGQDLRPVRALAVDFGSA